jgi:hypothetical protein
MLLTPALALLLVGLLLLLLRLVAHRYVALPFRVLGPNAPADIDRVKAAALQMLKLPPPRDHGRVMVVAKLLQQQGFKVVIECSLGLPMNYTVYGVRQEQREQQLQAGGGCTLT